MIRLYQVSPDAEYYAVDLVAAKSNAQARYLAFKAQECCADREYTEIRARLLKGKMGLCLTPEGDYPQRVIRVTGKGPVEVQGEPRVIDAAHWEEELKEILGDRCKMEEEPLSPEDETERIVKLNTDVPPDRKCRVCGCTQDHACPGGCYWVEEDLCSACAEELSGEGEDNI